MLLVSELGDFGNLLRSQLESRNFGDECLQPLPLGAGGDGHQALVNAPPQSYLRLGYPILLSQLLPETIHGAALGVDNRSQGSVARDGNVFLPMIFDEVAMLEVRMELDGVDCGWHLGGFEDRFQVFLEEVGHAYGLGPAGCLDGLHIGPLLLKGLGSLCWEGGMDEVEVNIIDTQSLEGRLERFRDGQAVGAVLGDDVQFLSGHPRLLDGGTLFLFVPIH